MELEFYDLHGIKRQGQQPMVVLKQKSLQNSVQRTILIVVMEKETENSSPEQRKQKNSSVLEARIIDSLKCKCSPILHGEQI